MLPRYEDILEAAAPKEPLWYTSEGVPRFAPFHPDMMGIYDRYVVYYRIACPSCHVEFNVAQSWDEHPKPCFTKRMSRLHFGDPPRHGCVGDTMNCDDIEVLEFWRKGNRKASWDWHRNRALEIHLNDYSYYRE